MLVLYKMPSLSKINESLTKLNSKTDNLPKGFVVQHKQGTIYNLNTLSGDTYSSAIDLKESGSDHIFKNLVLYGNSESPTGSIRVAIGESEDGEFYLLSQSSSSIRHTTASTKYDLNLVLKNVSLRYVKIYNENAITNLNLFFVATD